LGEVADENITIDELLAGLENKLCLADTEIAPSQENDAEL
jgi:hypothetical protein